MARLDRKNQAPADGQRGASGRQPAVGVAPLRATAPDGAGSAAAFAPPSRRPGGFALSLAVLWVAAAVWVALSVTHAANKQGVPYLGGFDETGYPLDSTKTHLVGPWPQNGRFAGFLGTKSGTPQVLGVDFTRFLGEVESSGYPV